MIHKSGQAELAVYRFTYPFTGLSHYWRRVFIHPGPWWLDFFLGSKGKKSGFQKADKSIDHDKGFWGITDDECATIRIVSCPTI